MSPTDPLNVLKNNLLDAVFNPILTLLFVAGLLVFVFGVVEFMWNLSGGESNKETGKKHMLWGIVGMFVMVSAYAIVALIGNTVASF